MAAGPGGVYRDAMTREDAVWTGGRRCTPSPAWWPAWPSGRCWAGWSSCRLAAIWTLVDWPVGWGRALLATRPAPWPDSLLLP